MRRYKKRSRRWKRIWRGDGVSGGGSKLQNWILRLTPDNGFYRAPYVSDNGAFAGANDAYFLGRGIRYPIALEGALKLKEISYIHAEGYAAGELKHGPIALIDDGIPVIVLSSNDTLNDKTQSNAAEVAARGAYIIEVGSIPTAMEQFIIPAGGQIIEPFLHTVAVQMIAYYAALMKGADVDQPKNWVSL